LGLRSVPWKKSSNATHPVLSLTVRGVSCAEPDAEGMFGEEVADALIVPWCAQVPLDT